MVLRSACGKRVSVFGLQLVSKGGCVGFDLLGVLLECWCVNFLQLGGNASNLVDVWSAL